MPKKSLPLISISIPVLNEVENIKPLHQRLCCLAKKMEHLCEFEFIFSDNFSTDGTWNIIKKISINDSRIKAVRFSRNFGFQRSILANFMYTKGDAVMQIDADLQDPPELLENFFIYWKKGYKVVYGIREKRKENKLINLLRKIGYRLVNLLSEQNIPNDAGDFRLIDRQVVDTLKNYRVRDPYIRGLIAEMGFKQIGINYNREKRIMGKSKFNMISLIAFTFTAIFNHSSFPLRLASLSGVIILGISILGSIYYLFLKILNPNLPEGLASIHIILLFGIGFHSLLLGIIGEYILRIYHVLRFEPVVIVEDEINIE